jgi:hypothetical protein
MKTIRLSDNVPQDLVLTSISGMRRLTPRGPQYRFLVKGNIPFLDVPVEAGLALEKRFADLGVVAGDRILVARTTSYPGGVLTRSYQVFKCDPPAAPIGQQSDGSFVVPRAPGANSGAPAVVPSRTLDPGHISLEGLRKAFALAHKFAQDPEVPADQKAQFREIRRLIWEACQ